MQEDMMYPELRGKTALVTGAGKKTGIGYAICKKLAGCGCHIIVADIGKADNYNSDVNIGSEDEMDRITRESAGLVTHGARSSPGCHGFRCGPKTHSGHGQIR